MLITVVLCFKYMVKTFILHRYLVFILFTLSCIHASGQSDTSNNVRNNFIKINLISLPPLMNNLNQKWIGLEYQRLISERTSLSLTFDVGRFEDYTFTKYHDYFDEHGGFSYTREEVTIPGFHIIPAVNYFLVHSPGKAGQGIYVGGRLDYYQYFMKKQVYESSIDQTTTTHNSTLRFDVGCGVGAQYLAFNRFTLDLNISLFTKIYSSSSNPQYQELYPENSFWRSNDNSTWTTINLMLGYAFGSGNKTKLQK